MQIRAKRIYNLDNYMRGVRPGTTVVPAMPLSAIQPGRLESAGFASTPAVGDTILPKSQGPVSRYNAEGSYIIHKDQPKETAYRQVMWKWVEWHGPYRRDQHDVRDVPYERYPRTFVPPPGVELTVAERDNEKFIVGPALEYIRGSEDLRHTINLFLELFGECVSLTSDLQPIVGVVHRRLNWEVLPKGELPWPQLSQRLRPIVKELPGGNQAVAWHRLEFMQTFEPSFTAVGAGGFRGYIVFGFPQAKLYFVESLHYGNATYVFGDDWERLSQMTKAEILNGDLQQARIIHTAGWEGRIRSALR